MTAPHQLKALPGQSQEPVRVWQRWERRRTRSAYKQLPPAATAMYTKPLSGDCLHLRGLILLLKRTEMLCRQSISTSVKAKGTAKYSRLSHAAFSHISIHCELPHALRHRSFNLGDGAQAFLGCAHPFDPPHL